LGAKILPAPALTATGEKTKKNRNRCKTAQLAPRRLIESNDSARKMYIHPMER